MKRVSTSKRILYALKSLWCRMRGAAVPLPESPNEIPVVINCYNRLTTLKRLISSLERRGITNIILLDNASTYPPLLEWYTKSPYEVIHLGANLGFKAIWLNADVRRRFTRGWYVYTDCDVELDPSCPDDVMAHLLHIMTRLRPSALKVGLGVRLDDLPACYALRDRAIAAEQPYWTSPEADGTIYRAPVDTTFALYRPYAGLNRSRAAEVYRTAPPYLIRHLPWYADSANPTDEDLHYTRSAVRPTAWTSAAAECEGNN